MDKIDKSSIKYFNYLDRVDMDMLDIFPHNCEIEYGAIYYNSTTGEMVLTCGAGNDSIVYREEIIDKDEKDEYINYLKNKNINR